jgi:hypothetical protein
MTTLRVGDKIKSRISGTIWTVEGKTDIENNITLFTIVSGADGQRLTLTQYLIIDNKLFDKLERHEILLEDALFTL